MQKIKTAEEIEKKQRLIKIVAGSVLIFLMVFSTAGFALNGIGGNDESLEDDEAYFDGQYWNYNLGGQQFYFSNKLEDINKISVPISLKINDFSEKVLYIDSEDIETSSKIKNNLGRYSLRVQEACYGECERDLPEKKCIENIIIFKESEKTKISQEENCIFIEGTSLEVDAFLYKILGLY